MSGKTTQLQIRIAPRQKALLKRLARQSGQDLSAYVLARALPPARLRFAELLGQLGDESERRYALAAIHDFLAGLPRIEFAAAVAEARLDGLDSYLRNYVAAMVELAANQKGAVPPAWVQEIEPLAEPRFATPIASLRPHLLLASPVPFKRRNLFIDSSVGDRV
jgi:Protein of unknown function (DUF1778)